MSTSPVIKVLNGADATANSDILPGGDAMHFDIEFSKTGTGTGTLHFETNNEYEADYIRAPTVGWVQHDMAAATGVTAGKIDVPATDPWTAKVKLTYLAAKRSRWVWTKAGGTVSMTCRVSYAKR